MQHMLLIPFLTPRLEAFKIGLKLKRCQVTRRQSSSESEFNIAPGPWLDITYSLTSKKQSIFNHF